MVNLLKEYIKENPNYTYKNLCEVFGLMMNNLLPLLDIKDYKRRVVPGVNPNNDYYIDVYSDDGKLLMYSEHASGNWIRYEYDDKGKLVHSYNSDGFNKRWEWLKDGENDVVHLTDSNGFWQYTFYGPDGEFIKKHDVNDEALDKKGPRIAGRAYLDESKLRPYDISNLH